MATVVKTGASSGSEESGGEKELPEGKEALDSHPHAGKERNGDPSLNGTTLKRLNNSSSS